MMETVNAIARALRDTAQSASNAVASGVSGPVDLIAMGMRAAGLPVERPFGGSEWMAQRGLTREVPMGIPRIVGETIGLAAPSVIAGKAPQIAAQVLRGQDAAKTAGRELGRTAAGRLEDHMVRQGMIQPITVWHGSPHRFDRFDASKIGTGEGAQAYGHGIYTAEAREVADQYRVNLSYDPEKMKVGGKQINAAYDQIQNAAARMPPARAQAEYEKLELLESLMMNNSLADVRASAGSMSPSTRQWFEKQVAPSFQTYGNLYKVDLPDEHVARMLDWDKPLIQQPAGVRQAFPTTFDEARGLGAQARALRKQADAIYGIDPAAAMALDKRADNLDLQRVAIGQDNATGANLYRLLNRNPQETADILRQQGIPGIRYLDGGSRGQGKGTSNFVVFPGNEDMLRIQEINGQPVQAVIDALRRSR